MTKKKSKGKVKASSYNVVSVSSKEAEMNVVALTDSEKEESAFAAKQDALPKVRTRFSKQYLKEYDLAMASLSEPTKKTAKQPTK